MLKSIVKSPSSVTDYMNCSLLCYLAHCCVIWLVVVLFCSLLCYLTHCCVILFIVVLFGSADQEGKVKSMVG